tara:strand:+ start:21046 stop:21951 length:906 start_codon:yes stop_codon:yes gene_type:complete
MKDLLLILPTKNNPDKCLATLQMLRRTAASQENYDVLLIIDGNDEQTNQYKKIIDEQKKPGFYPLMNNVLIERPEPTINRCWWHIIQSVTNFLNKNNYYFNWWVTDDFTNLEGGKYGWDISILNKKHYFKDDLFVMHQSRNFFGHGRETVVFENHYQSDKILKTLSNKNRALYKNDAHVIWNFSEQLPITTNKFRLLIHEIMREGYLTSQHELLIAATILLLSKKYNLNRLIDSGVVWESLHDSKNSESIGLANYGPGAGNEGKDIEIATRKDCFFNWAQDNEYAVVMQTVDKIAAICQSK